MSNPKEDPKTKQATNFAKYSGIAFQLLATIGLFAFIGYKIDQHRQSDKLIFTALFGVAGVALSLFQVVRSLRKP